MSYTKGPWIAIETDSEKFMASVQDGSQSEIALIAGVNVDEANANARLIAAAPDLLKALERIADLPNKSSLHTEDDLAVLIAKQAVAGIRHATG